MYINTNINKMKLYKYIIICFCVLCVPFMSNAQETEQEVFDDASDIEVPADVQKQLDAINSLSIESDQEISERLTKMENSTLQEESEEKLGVVCSDYYKFQSVQVSVGVDEDAYKSGNTIKFKGNVINENTYPVVDGNVFVRISRDNENYQSEGYYVVDEFFAQEGMALNSGEKQPVAFNWTMPEDITDGQYRADYFFSVGKKFNLGGLPFTNEVTIGSSTFYISSSEKGYLSFDRSDTKVNGETYKHIGNWPEIDPGTEVVITQPLSNTLDTKKDVNVTYELYYWDSMDKKDLIDTKTEKLTMQPGDVNELQYIIPKMDESVYYLKIIANSGDHKSIVNIRVVSLQERARLNYPAITKFPLKNGDSFTLFSCFHNTARIPSSGKIEVTLTDKSGNIIDELVYDGTITSGMMADKIDIIADDNYNYVQLQAKVYDVNGELIDEYETIYDCEQFNNICEDIENNNKQDSVDQQKKNVAMIILAVVTMVVVIMIGVIIKRKNSNK